MNKKAAFVQGILNDLFPNPLPPLNHINPYTLLIAVVLSAQNRDERVNQVTPPLFSKASTPKEMVKLSIAEIAAMVKPCGFFLTKAKNIWNLSKILIDRHEGEVPISLKALKELPGVGQKTASVVMAQAFGFPAFPVDTHVFRCARRWGLSHGSTVTQVEADLKQLFPKKNWGRLHLQIIYFARAYCPARGKHENCPICHF